MNRTVELVIALLVSSLGVIAALLTDTVFSLLLPLWGLVLLLRIVIRWGKEHGRRADPNYDKNYAAQSRKWQLYMMTTMMFLMVVFWFPVSDWKFWLCMACLILNTALTIGGFANSTDESTSCSPGNSTARSRKWQLYVMSIMTSLMVVGLFPVSDWKFWLCMTWLVVNAVFRYSRIRKEQSAIKT